MSIRTMMQRILAPLSEILTVSREQAPLRVRVPVKTSHHNPHDRQRSNQRRKR